MLPIFISDAKISAEFVKLWLNFTLFFEIF